MVCQVFFSFNKVSSPNDLNVSVSESIDYDDKGGSFATQASLVLHPIGSDPLPL